MSIRPITPFEGMDIRTLIDSQANVRGNHPFLIWEPLQGEAKTWSYRAFAEAVRRFAAGLAARGVRPRERVLVHLDNCPESVIAWLGCAYAGAVAVTTNARSVHHELEYFASHSRAVGAITQPKFASLVESAARNVGWICLTETDNGEPADRPSGFESFDAIAADAAPPERAYDPMAPFAVQYTSGTTSRPKAVLWSHANALFGARMSALHEDLRPSDVHLAYLPLFHTNAQVYSVLASLWAGATCVIMPKFSASRFWPISLKHRATWTSMVPFCLKALTTLPAPAQHSYRYWGNAICSPPTDSVFNVRTIGWWGMTETVTHGIVGAAHQHNAPMSLGRPSPAFGIYVLGEDGARIGPGETGDLYVRGERGVSLFLEYADDPQATRNAFTDDGLFITGDRVRLDEHGFLFFADRAKDMLKVGGENVAASEIEAAIMAVPGVGEVAVVAMKHPMLDEAPVAFVVPAAGDQKDLSERIMAACDSSLAPFKRPHQVRIVDSLPRSTLEKIAKSELRALLERED